ncbi:MAG: HAD hydrolase-like protein [Gammaproteobacteria bacterium]|nr:HAD hydrolase-like protein [Gammaproteobacteria bacterium]
MSKANDGEPRRPDWVQPELIAFDFDGTLADSFPWFAAELNAVARDWGFRQIPAEDATRLRRLSAEAIFRELRVPRWKIPWIARDLRRRMARDIDRITLFDGVAPLLNRLAARDRRVAIMSSNTLDNIRTVLGPALCAGIEAFECGAALNGKAQRLKRLSRRTGVPTAAMLYIGDEVRDIEAARRAGATAGAVAWGYNCETVLCAMAPDRLFQAVAELSEQLLGAPDPCQPADSEDAARW